jgi:hypothetical protein
MFRFSSTPTAMIALLGLSLFAAPDIASADDDRGRCDRRGRGNAYGHYKNRGYQDARYRDNRVVYGNPYRGNAPVYRDDRYRDGRYYDNGYRYQQPRSTGTSAAIIGGTAAAGAGVGAVLGGWKGAVIGGTAGAGAGVIYDQATRDGRRRR